VVIRSDGHILTNDHVIAPAGSRGRLGALFDDATSHPARIVGRDPRTDLAVLKVDDVPSLETMEIGSSERLVVGQPVVALGAPLGLSSTVTTGVVSALGRTVRVPAQDIDSAVLVGALQTDAAINPGNSGGALVDCSAALVGVNTAGATVPDEQGNASGGSIGIGFAIPVDFAMRIAEELIEEGSVSHAYMGVRTAPVADADSNQRGLYVLAVATASPAAAAGLRTGDVITALDGEDATRPDALDVLSVTRSPGDTVTVTFVRSGSTSDADVVLSAEPRALTSAS
jgi:putative serine protease PepD